MRRLPVLVLSLLALLAGFLLPTSGASAAARRSYPATQTTVVRPVNLSGHAAPGFTVGAPFQRFPIDCSFAFESFGALSPNIEWCSPTAATAIACWKAAAAHKTLCLTDVFKHRLSRFPLRGRFAPSAVRPSEEQAPLGLVLADGQRCWIRDGGAWESLPHHPNLYGTYSCEHNAAVWAVLDARHAGVNESHPSWTVRVGRFGHRTLVTKHVARAWFVATLHA
jgi:hypothetical protein